MNTLRALFIVLCMFCWISISAFAGNSVVTVPPPNGTDDTAVIQAALDQCVTPNSGCTVQLDAGTYLTKQLFAKDFQGAFKGMGMDVTVIQALPDLPVNQDNPYTAHEPTASNHYPMFILFYGGDINVSDMTIRATEPNQVESYYEQKDFQTTYMWAVLEFMSPSEKMNAVMTRVALEGVRDESGPEYSDRYNATGLSLDPYPPSLDPSPGRLSGIFRVSACRFDTFAEGIFAAVLRDAQLTIGGSPSEGNLIRNCGWGALFYDLDSGVLDFSHNDVSVDGTLALAAFGAGQNFYAFVETPSSILVQHNHIKATGAYQSGIWLVDFGPFSAEGGGKSSDFVISNNEITMGHSQGIPAYAGIQTDFTVGSVISNNRITGSGVFGISVEGDTQCMLKANNVQKLTADAAPIGLMINTWFGSYPASDCTVVAGNTKTDVYDEGVNNTLVGVNNMQGNPPGPAIRDAMKRKMEMTKSMRKF